MKLPALYRRSKLCHYCGIKVVLEQGRHDSATRDEVVPRSQGGLRTARNVVMACFTCNNTKGDRSYAEFFAWVQVNGRPAKRSQPNAARLKKQRPVRPPTQHDASLEAIIKGSDAPWGRKKMKAPKEPAPASGIATLGDVLVEALKR